MVNGINFAAVGQRVISFGKTLNPWIGIAAGVSLVAIAVIKLIGYYQKPSHRITPISEARPFIAHAQVLSPGADYSEASKLYKNVAQIISGHLGTAGLASLARVNRVWYNAAQPVLRSHIRLSDDFTYGLETAWKERKERHITQKVYYDRPKDAFYVFNNFLGENAELFEIGQVLVEAHEPVQMQLGENSIYVIKPKRVTFTPLTNIKPELLAKGREFQALSALL